MTDARRSIPAIGLTSLLPGNTFSAKARSSSAQVILQHALEHGAQIGGRLEVAVLVEIRRA